MKYFIDKTKPKNELTTLKSTVEWVAGAKQSHSMPKAKPPIGVRPSYAKASEGVPSRAIAPEGGSQNEKQTPSAALGTWLGTGARGPPDRRSSGPQAGSDCPGRLGIICRMLLPPEFSRGKIDAEGV